MLKKFTKLFVDAESVSSAANLVRTINQIQTQIESSLTPLVTRLQNDSLILNQIQLKVGTNVINHMLGRNLTGWSLVRQRSLASIYDNQDDNLSPNLTLILISSAVVTVDIQVF